MDLKRLDHEEILKLLTEGLWQSHQQTFEFFKKRLGELCQVEISKDNSKINEEQLDYVSEMLMEFSMKSLNLGSWPLASPPSKESEEIKLLRNLYNVRELPLAPPLCEKLGKTLLFVGSFEEDRIKGYYTDYWLITIGERLFLKAAASKKTDLLLGISQNFGLWLNYLRALKYNLIRKEAEPLIKIIPR